MKYLVLLLLLVSSTVLANGRCEQYTQGVRKAHSFYFGLDFPYQYGIGQLEQESGCRNITSRDGIGSSTPAQITYSFWQKHLNKAGIGSANWLIHQAYIMKDASNQNPYKKLWVTYQIYNGSNLVIKEIEKAGKVDWQAAKDKCKRGYTTFSNGQRVSNCGINYDYSIKVYNYGKNYNGIDSKTYKFW